MEIGICTTPQDAPSLPAAAFDFIEGHVQNFLLPEKPDSDFKPNLDAARASARPVRSANCFLPGSIPCIGPNIDSARILRYADTAFRRAHEVGMGIIVFGSGVARKIPDGYPAAQAMRDFVGLLRQIGPIAQKHDITVVVEPLNRTECNFINSLAEGAEAVVLCNHPNIRLLADYYHMLMENEPATEIDRFGHLLAHTHIAELAGRGFPGKSGENLRPFFEALRRINYHGRVAIECNWDKIAADLPLSAAYLREQML